MKFGVLLWHNAQPIGICLFVAPHRSLRLRNQFFGHRGGWNRASLLALNQQLVTLQRVVIHPPIAVPGWPRPLCGEPASCARFRGSKR